MPDVRARGKLLSVDPVSFREFAALFLFAVETGHGDDVDIPAEYVDDYRVKRMIAALSGSGVAEPVNILGSGSFGIAAATGDGRVVKLTTDPTEVAAGTVLRSKTLQHVVRIDGSWFVRGAIVQPWDRGTEHRVGLLVMEKLEPIFKGDPGTKLLNEIWMQTRRDTGTHPDRLAVVTPQEARDKLLVASDTLEQRLRSAAQRDDRKLLRDVADALAELRSVGVYAIDAHSGNVGWSPVDSVYKLFDIGTSSSPRGTQPGELPQETEAERAKTRSAHETLGVVDESVIAEEIGEAGEADGHAVTIPLRRLYAWKPKLAETMLDVQEGRLSYSSGQPLRVTRLDSPRGAFFILDGHHRAVESALRGDAVVHGVVDPEMPRIERTGGAHRSVVEQKANVLEFATASNAAGASEDVIPVSHSMIEVGAERVAERFANMLRTPFSMPKPELWFFENANNRRGPIVVGSPSVEFSYFTPFKHTDLCDVLGFQINKIMVHPVIVWTDSPEQPLVLDAYTSGVEDGDGNIWVRVNASSAYAKRLVERPSEFTRQFSTVLLHEVTHLRDYIRNQDVVNPMRGKYPADDPRMWNEWFKYYNSPHELRAYMAQVVDDVLYFMWSPLGERTKQVAEMKRDNPNEWLVDEALGHAKHWKQIKGFLTTDNQAKVLRTVYRALDREGFLVQQRAPRLPKTAREAGRVDATPLPFALVRVDDVVAPMLLSEQGGDLVGLDIVDGVVARFGPEAIVGLVNAEPAAVWYGVRAELQSEALPLAAEEAAKRGEVIIEFPGFRARKGKSFAVRPRGHRFQWTPEKPRGLSAFAEVKPVLLRQRMGVPSVDSIRLATIFAGLTVHAETWEAEETFQKIVREYDRMHGSLPPVEVVQDMIRHLRSQRVGMYESARPWSQTVHDALSRGLRDRELRRFLWNEVPEEDQLYGIGLAKMSFALMMLGQNLCCLDTWIISFMYAADVDDDHDRRQTANRISGQWKARVPISLERYEQVEDAFLKNNPWYDNNDVIGRAQAQWCAWEWAIGAPAYHRPWLDVAAKLQLQTKAEFPRPANVPF